MTGATRMKNQYVLILALTALVACGDGENQNLAVGALASDRIELTAETSEPIVAVKTSRLSFMFMIWPRY